MKKIILSITLFLAAFALQAQTVENIRVEQDGEKLKITYRIGASTQSQLFDVVMSCSMDGGARFEPSAVIGDVGANIVGGKSVYTIFWDVFKDVDEVVNPEFFVRVEQTNAAPVAAATTTRAQEQETQEPVNQPTQTEDEVEQAMNETPQNEAQRSEPAPAKEEKSGPDFSKNGFFAYSGTIWHPIGIRFGSLNNWGYFVTPIRMGSFAVYDYYSSYEGAEYAVVDFEYTLSAGVTKHIVGSGPYRLHGYGGLGLHMDFNRIGVYEMMNYSHAMLDTGVIGAIGGFYASLGFIYSFGFYDPFAMTFGIGFVF